MLITYLSKKYKKNNQTINRYNSPQTGANFETPLFYFRFNQSILFIFCLEFCFCFSPSFVKVKFQTFLWLCRRKSSTCFVQFTIFFLFLLFPENSILFQTHTHTLTHTRTHTHEWQSRAIQRLNVAWLSISFSSSEKNSWLVDYSHFLTHTHTHTHAHAKSELDYKTSSQTLDEQ